MSLELESSWREELIARYGWGNQESVKRWVQKLKTEKYADACLRWGLALHCFEVGRTPDQLIELRIKQINNSDPRIRSQAEDTVLRIYSKLAETKAGMAINYFRKMKSFYKHNYCPLGCTDPGYDIQREVQDRRVLEKLDKFKTHEISRTLRSFLTNPSIRIS